MSKAPPPHEVGTDSDPTTSTPLLDEAEVPPRLRLLNPWASWTKDNSKPKLVLLLFGTYVLVIWSAGKADEGNASTPLLVSDPEVPPPRHPLNPFATWTKHNAKAKAILLIGGNFVCFWGAVQVDLGQYLFAAIGLVLGGLLVGAGLYARIPLNHVTPEENEA
ncbi:uncharacterized protein LOC62_01G001736 [Vanrija pseudolonga]|uniref:Uncharacterized protein n=1 Tax=Vanrija pseudolonga TaxID=143232 RepID=A0AAF0Y1G9_9TREE|nr:hypothetical protein LOC62_01G001736 [Vanrija pseudolonga]